VHRPAVHERHPRGVDVKVNIRLETGDGRVMLAVINPDGLVDSDEIARVVGADLREVVQLIVMRFKDLQDATIAALASSGLIVHPTATEPLKELS